MQKTLSHLEAAAKGGHAEAQMQYGLFRTNNIYTRKALNTIIFKKKEVVGYLQESIKILDRKNLTEAQIAIVKERLEVIEKEDSCVVM